MFCLAEKIIYRTRLIIFENLLIVLLYETKENQFCRFKTKARA